MESSNNPFTMLVWDNGQLIRKIVTSENELANVMTLILTSIFTVFVLCKLFLSKKFAWKDYGVSEIDTSAVLGRLDLLLGRKRMINTDDYAYSKMGPTDKCCGIMEKGKPLLFIKDAELIKNVFIKDADHFLDRRQVFNDADGPLKKMLPNLEGDEWKGVRMAVTPAFTTENIQRMMEHFNRIGLEWVRDLTRKSQQESKRSVAVNVRETVIQYTLEVISNAVFGMNANVIKNPDSIFGKMAHCATQFNKFEPVKLGVGLNFPWLSSRLGSSIVDRESLAIFEQMLEQRLKSRWSGETQENDFLRLLVEARQRELDVVLSDTEELGKRYLTKEIMNAQSAVFFFAGYNTTNNLITFTLYALALHPSVQTKLREEVNKIVVEENDSFDYADIMELTYLDMVISEVLRKFPSASRLERVCSREYRDATTGLKIPKGTIVAIPVNGIHNDRKYYDNPEEFDPEHFSLENKAKRDQYTFVPFGIGQMNCIGKRFAQIVVKSAIAHMVHRFIVEPTANTPVPMQGISTGLQLIPPKDLELKLTPIDQS